MSKEEKIDRKVKAKSNVSPKRAATGKKITAKTTKTATEPKESKYFQSPVKKEEVEDEAAYDSEDDFDIPTTGAPALSPKMEKDGEEDDSDEDEGDWEEVEGLSTSFLDLLREKVYERKYNVYTRCEKSRVTLTCFSAD